MSGRSKVLQIPTNGILLADVPHDVFFRVLTSTGTAPCAEYVSQRMVCVHDSGLPHEMRRNDDTSALFLFLEQKSGKRGRYEFLLREVDFDLADDTVVVIESPSTEEAHARERYPTVRLTDTPPQSWDFRSLRLGRLHKDGTILHGMRGDGRRRGRGSGAGKKHRAKRAS